MENLKVSILGAVKKAQNQEIQYEELFTNAEKQPGNNEFLLFIKPEITLKSDDIQLEKILNLILEQIGNRGFNIHNVKVLGAEYLEKHNIIAQHYGVINKIATQGAAGISDSAREQFQEIYGKSIDECDVLGGFQFLERYPDFTPYSLDVICQNKASSKLAGGTYCIEVKMDAETVHLINGFHPRQLVHFTTPGRSIVVFTLSGDIDWADARQNFIGATNPEKANDGSIRKMLLNQKDELGLAEVSQGSNGVHLSAGPIEGLVELMRYNSNYSDGSVKTYKDFAIGKKLEASFDSAQIDFIISNKDFPNDGKAVSVFDLTEEENTDKAIELIKEQF